MALPNFRLPHFPRRHSGDIPQASKVGISVQFSPRIRQNRIIETIPAFEVNATSRASLTLVRLPPLVSPFRSHAVRLFPVLAYSISLYAPRNVPVAADLVGSGPTRLREQPINFAPSYGRPCCWACGLPLVPHTESPSVLRSWERVFGPASWHPGDQSSRFSRCFIFAPSRAVLSHSPLPCFVMISRVARE